MTKEMLFAELLATRDQMESLSRDVEGVLRDVRDVRLEMAAGRLAINQQLAQFERRPRHLVL